MVWQAVVRAMRSHEEVVDLQLVARLFLFPCLSLLLILAGIGFSFPLSFILSRPCNAAEFCTFCCRKLCAASSRQLAWTQWTPFLTHWRIMPLFTRFLANQEEEKKKLTAALHFSGGWGKNKNLFHGRSCAIACWCCATLARKTSWPCSQSASRSCCLLLLSGTKTCLLKSSILLQCH